MTTKCAKIKKVAHEAIAECVTDVLGVLLAPVKTVGPDTVLQFAGITLDSVRKETRLPDQKLQKCSMLLHNFYKRRTV